MTESDAMARAIDLAWRGWGRVHPNPMVGAVVLSPSGEPLGEGYHAEFGQSHAEPAALRAAGDRARGATLVVTLEPCAHHGKQPPCVDAILAAGIKRVVYAMPDPNPMAAGGAEQLAAAGVEVVVGSHGWEAAAQNAAFAFTATHDDRPYVALKLATTIDGRIADRDGQSKWISGEIARDYVHWLRAGFDAIAVGGRTATLDDPALTVRGLVQPRVPPTRIVFDRRAQVSPTLQVFRTAPELSTWVVTGSGASPEHTGALEAAGAIVIHADGPERALRAIRARGIRSLLVEGGGRLAGSLFGLGLVDRFYWIQTPTFLGDSGMPAFPGIPGRPIAEIERWRVVDRRALGGDTLLVVDR